MQELEQLPSCNARIQQYSTGVISPVVGVQMLRVEVEYRQASCGEFVQVLHGAGGVVNSAPGGAVRVGGSRSGCWRTGWRQRRHRKKKQSDSDVNCDCHS